MFNLSQLRRQDASPALVLAIVCAGVVLASLDLFIVNLAMPSMARDLHQHSLSTLSWVLNGYAIVYASLLVLLGRLSEARARQNAFLVGALLFTLASAACGAATNLGMLIAFRVIQAAGAALLTPASLGMVLATTAPEKRAGAVRAWTAVGGAAAALGPVVGGPLVAIDWRWIFFVNVPIGLAAVIIGWMRLPNVPGHPVKRPDALGAALVTAGVGLLSLGLVEGDSWGWGSARVIGALAVALVMLGGFIVHLLRHHNPLFDPSLFRAHAFRGASIVAVMYSIAFGAMLLSIVLWMQDVWHWSALQTGLAFAPGPLMVPLFGLLLTGRLIARFGPGRVILVGASIYAAGVAWWALRAGVHPNYLGQVLPGTLLTGAGVGLTMPTFMSTGAGALPPQAFATGSAVLNMLRQVGLAVGVAVFVAVVGVPKTAQASLTAWQHGWIVIAATALLSAIVGAVSLRRPRAVGADDADGERLPAPGLPPATAGTLVAD
ncbi:MAG TPA: DHA2 family efflux MFS transporter permease subunit [Solirubrobacteraceae bacterium]|jgi:EmrB/QacA subfamily drug resistance transporter|nr:DHA2 family efflux MFS transporter permease subunit [Solirubrobacteraceae bacterium]